MIPIFNRIFGLRYHYYVGYIIYKNNARQAIGGSVYPADKKSKVTDMCILHDFIKLTVPRTREQEDEGCTMIITQINYLGYFKK